MKSWTLGNMKLERKIRHMGKPSTESEPTKRLEGIVKRIKDNK